MFAYILRIIITCQKLSPKDYLFNKKNAKIIRMGHI
jgi:hypothetical protein